MLKKILIILTIASIAAAFYFLGGAEYFLPETYQRLYAEHPWLTAGIYFVVYVIATSLSLPGASLMTILAGLVFGLATGTLLVSFASSIGATIAFLLSRTLLGEWVQSKFGKHLSKINEGVDKDGGFYLFSLRLMPIFPFFVINLVMGLTRLPAVTFYWVSQLGMLPATLVFVNAGAQVADIQEVSIKGILTPGLIVGLVALGLFPIAAKYILAAVQKIRKNDVNSDVTKEADV